VSITRRIIDSARSGINSVMERIAADDQPLTHVDPAELQRELEQRLAARQAGARAPQDNPRARMAGASAEAREQRAALAEKRAARVRAAREQRERAAQAAQEEFFRRARAEAARQPASSSARAGGPAGASSSSSSSSSSSGGGRRPAGGHGPRSPFGRQDHKIAEYYKVLDLPDGADFAQVKSQYRKLMRKYHPDRHVGNPKKLKAATELSMRVTQAYNALEEHLKGKK
jgi:DnaJ-domain-containing protein 1